MTLLIDIGIIYDAFATKDLNFGCCCWSWQKGIDSKKEVLNNKDVISILLGRDSILLTCLKYCMEEEKWSACGWFLCDTYFYTSGDVDCDMAWCGKFPWEPPNVICIPFYDK